MFLKNKKSIKKLVFECPGVFRLENDAIESDFPFEVQTKGSTAHIVCEDGDTTLTCVGRGGSMNQIITGSNVQIGQVSGSLSVTTRGGKVYIEGPGDVEVYLNGKHLGPTGGETEEKKEAKKSEPRPYSLDLSKIESVEVLGSAEVSGRLDPKRKEIDLSVSGSGDLDVEVGDGCSVTASVQGSGDLVVRGGGFGKIDCNIAGSGDIVVKGQSAKLLDIQVVGSGDATVRIPREKIGSLRQRIVGIGDIHLG